MSEFSVTFLVLVNSKSGGQDGPHLLEKFTEIFREVSSRLWVWGLTRQLSIKLLVSRKLNENCKISRVLPFFENTFLLSSIRKITMRVTSHLLN